MQPRTCQLISLVLVNVLNSYKITYLTTLYTSKYRNVVAKFLLQNPFIRIYW
jgi:hypothetical protein